MAYPGSAIWLVVGAVLVSLFTRLGVSPAAWIALTLLVHASRSMPAWPGLLYLWMALYAALAIGNRNILSVSGAGYFVIVAFVATSVAIPFALDLVAAPGFSGVAS